MSILVREADKADMKAVFGLINELADHEDEPEAVDLTIADLERYGFGKNPSFHCFVAEKNNTIVGTALVYKRFSTWKGSVLHLEDLVVSQSMRGHGVGTLLLNSVVAYGKKLGMKRISWEVSDSNKGAIAFYKEKGANIMRNWNVVHLDEAAIDNYLSNI